MARMLNSKLDFIQFLLLERNFTQSHHHEFDHLNNTLTDSQSVVSTVTIGPITHHFAVIQLSDDEFIHTSPEMSDGGYMGRLFKFSEYFDDILPVSTKIFEPNFPAATSGRDIQVILEMSRAFMLEAERKLHISGESTESRKAYAEHVGKGTTFDPKDTQRYIGHIVMPEFYNDQIPKGLTALKESTGVSDSEESSEEENEEESLTSEIEKEYKVQLPLNYPPIPTGGVSGDLFGVHDQNPFGRLPNETT